MSRIDETFRKLRVVGRTGLITYVTAGDPALETSAGILQRLDAAGVDLLEVGVPFSDPLADGPVIQRATERALAAGATLPRVLDMVGAVRGAIGAPIVLFSYANPILRLGLDRFAQLAAGAGVDGVLTLDLPPEEAEEFQTPLSAAGIDTIFLGASRNVAASGPGLRHLSTRARARDRPMGGRRRHRQRARDGRCRAWIVGRLAG
jgi:tryptophan synthase alpha chain